MAKGLLISRAMRELIAAIAVENDALIAREVMQEAAIRAGRTGERVPGLSAVQKLVTAARRKDPRDGPWNLGISLKFSIPESATGVLMRVKAYCMAAGLTLTLRDAQWISRLVSVLPEDGHPAPIYRHAHRYAIRERVYKALDVDLNTSDLDQVIIATYAMTEFESEAARATGQWLQPGPSVGVELSILGEEDLDSPHRFCRWVVEESLGLEGSAVFKYDDIDKFADEALKGGEADRVYAYWLQYISKGPGWADMARERRQELARHLHEEVQAIVQATEEHKAERQSKANLFKSPPYRNWRPIRILEEIGYQDRVEAK